MASRKSKLSCTLKHRSRSLSPFEPTDLHDVEQSTNPLLGTGAPPLISQESTHQDSRAPEIRSCTGRPSGRIIPDSQEDPSDISLSDNTDDVLEPEQAPSGIRDLGSESVVSTEEDLEAQHNAASYNTVDTVLIPGGVKLAPRPNLLRQKGINCNGRLAIEHRDYEDEDMEDEATQPSTQPHFDTRRHGTSSMLSLEDEADVVCILHPTTPAAYRAAELMARVCPQHILQNQGLSCNLDYEADMEVPTTRPNNADPDDEDHLACTQAGDVRETEMPESSSKDIALRFSSKVHDICMGWSFGRNPSKCDLPIVDVHQTLKISNMHFRIYFNPNGVLMLEDTSTNGTWVDKTHLQSKSLAGHKPRRTIQAGSIIEILLSSPDPCMRFVVSVPSRDRAENQYNQNLRDYMAEMQQLERRANLTGQNGAAGNLMAPPPMLPFGREHRNAALVAPEIIAPPRSYNHGSSWNGGEKYNVVAHIGKGAFANVYKLATKQDGEVFATKEIEKRKFMKDGSLSHKAHNEILVMKQLNHPNIIDYIGYEETEKNLYIIMEYVSWGDLSQYSNPGSIVPEYKCRYVAHQMMNALDYLHKANITHRDIKPDNILIASHDPFTVKLSDFGLSKVIDNDETFLKTFCGTLLYLAPEVYPGYEKVKAGLPQKRRREHDDKLPYKSSVDTWAFGAVLYHLMCGRAPYTGSTEDRGAQMLEIIMHNPVDFDRLTRAGVSSEGSDFVRKMLVHEPSDRATDAECLKHSWIRDLSLTQDVDVEMEHSVDDDGDELDASQLSLHDGAQQARFDDSYDDEGMDPDELKQLRRSKRMRTDSTRAMGFRPEDPSSSADSYNTIPMMIVGPELREAMRAQPHHNREHDGQERLFGEIGTSALRSSGVLGQDAHAALDISMEGSRDGSVSVAEASAVNCSTGSHVSPYPQPLPGPAPSLLGTEALVDQMNMASPKSAGPSVPSVDSKSGTPRTPRTREPSPTAVAGAKRSSQDFEATPEQTPSKRAKPRRSATPSQLHDETSDGPAAAYAAQAGAQDTASHDQHQQHATQSKSPPKKAAAGQGRSDKNGQPSGAKDKGKGKATTASNTEASGQQTLAGAESHAPTQRNDDSSSGTNSTITSTVPDSSFPVPAPVLGRLNTVPGSIIDTKHFNLTNRLTYYGRYQETQRPLQPGEFDPPWTSYVYPNSLDNRVPKNALDLMFWRSGIEADERAGVDWIAKDDFWCILSTRTSACIWVNGIKIERGKDCWKYGKLYTGDIVTVFGPKHAGAQGRGGEYLKFECEFFAGLSKPRRPQGHAFTVEKETKHFMENKARRSREASSAGSTIGPEESTDAGGSGSTTPAPQ